MDLASLKAKSRTLTVEFDGETLKVDYAPHKIDSEMLDRLNASVEVAESEEDDSKKANYLARSLMEILSGWDMLDGGEPMPLVAGSLMKIPVDLLAQVNKAVWDDLNTGKPPVPSPDGS